MYLPNTPLWWSKASAQCDFSKHSGIKRKEGERKGGREGSTVKTALVGSV